MTLLNSCKDLKYFNSNLQNINFVDKYGVVSYRNQTDFSNDFFYKMLGVWCGNDKDETAILENPLIEFEIPFNINSFSYVGQVNDICRICLGMSFISDPLESATIPGNNKHYNGLLLKTNTEEKTLIDSDLSWNDLLIGAINKNSENFEYTSEKFDFNNTTTNYFSPTGESLAFTNSDLPKIISQDLTLKKNNTKVSYYFFEINIRKKEFRLGYKNYNGGIFYGQKYPIPTVDNSILLLKGKYKFCLYDIYSNDPIDTKVSLDVKYTPFGSDEESSIYMSTIISKSSISSLSAPNPDSFGQVGFYSECSQLYEFYKQFPDLSPDLKQDLLDTCFPDIFSTAGLTNTPLIINQLGQRSSNDVFEFCSIYIDRLIKIFPIHYVYHSSMDNNIHNNLLNITKNINDIYQFNFGTFFKFVLGDKISDPIAVAGVRGDICNIIQEYGYQCKLTKRLPLEEQIPQFSAGNAYLNGCKNWVWWREWPSNIDRVWKTVAHELGHNLGAQHDPGAVRNPDGTITFPLEDSLMGTGSRNLIDTKSKISINYHSTILNNLQNSNRGYIGNYQEGIGKPVYLTANLPKRPLTEIDNQGSFFLYYDNLNRLFVKKQNTDIYTMVLDETGLPIQYDFYLNKGWKILLAEQNDILMQSTIILKNIQNYAILIWKFFPSWIKNGENSIMYTIYDNEYYSIESLFNIDLNNDSYIGIPPNGVPELIIPQPLGDITYIDSVGNTRLFYDSIGNVFAENNANSNAVPILNISEILNINNMFEEQLLGIENYENEYHTYLLFKNANNNLIYLWSINIFSDYWSLNDYIGPYDDIYSNSVRDLEYRFNIDLNNDGIIGNDDASYITIDRDLPSRIEIKPNPRKPITTLSIWVTFYDENNLPVYERFRGKDIIYVWQINTGTPDSPNWIDDKIEYSRSLYSDYRLDINTNGSAVRCVVYYGEMDSDITIISTECLIFVADGYSIVCNSGDVYVDFIVPNNIIDNLRISDLFYDYQEKISYIQKFPTALSTSPNFLIYEDVELIEGINFDGSDFRYWPNVWYPTNRFNSKWVGLISGYYTPNGVGPYPAGSVGLGVLNENRGIWPGLDDNYLLPGEKYRIHFVEDFDGPPWQSLRESFIVSVTTLNTSSSSSGLNIDQMNIQSSSQVGGFCCDPNLPCEPYTQTFTINSKGSFIVPSGNVIISDLSNLEKVKQIIDVKNVSNYWENNNSFANLQLLDAGSKYYVLSKDRSVDETYNIAIE